jgi:hypothetical protein
MFIVTISVTLPITLSLANASFIEERKESQWR